VRIVLASDHAGFDLKQVLASALRTHPHSVEDLGAHSTDPVDYPDAAEAVATALSDGRAERGIIVCGSGAGVSIAANKFPGVRAAVCHDHYTAHQAVEHDDMNVLCLGARVIGEEVAQELVRTFLAAHFSNQDRHRRRLGKILAFESRLTGGT